MTEYHLETPLSEEVVRKLKLGDIVYLSGNLYGTGGIERGIIEAIKKGEKPPVDLKGAVSGTAPYITTSARYQSDIPEFIKLTGVRGIYGKGSLDKSCLDAMKTYGCVYLSGIGGACNKPSHSLPSLRYTESVVDQTRLSWPKDVPREMTEFKLEKFGPLFVTMDADGHSVETEIKMEEKLPEIYKQLGALDAMIPYHL